MRRSPNLSVQLTADGSPDKDENRQPPVDERRVAACAACWKNPLCYLRPLDARSVAWLGHFPYTTSKAPLWRFMRMAAKNWLRGGDSVGKTTTPRLEQRLAQGNFLASCASQDVEELGNLRDQGTKECVGQVKHVWRLNSTECRNVTDQRTGLGDKGLKSALAIPCQ